MIRDLNQLPFFLGLLVKSLGPSSLMASFDFDFDFSEAPPIKKTVLYFFFFANVMFMFFLPLDLLV